MSTGKLYIRGTISNGLAAAILYGVCQIAEGQLRKYVVVAVAVQLLVFLIHGLPHRSEKFYDLSGSVTHFLVVSSSLLRESKVRSVRQIITALASTVWMTRLGTFLFLRINRDGKDERFAAITPVWLSFLGAWMLQAAWVILTQLPVILMNEVGASTSAASGGGLSTLEETPLGLLDAACAITWLVGFCVEFTADLEKFTFRGEAKNRDKFISSGLWAMCRHPNYLGEITMWTAIAIATSQSCSMIPISSGSPSSFWTILGTHLGTSSPLKWAWLSPAFTAFLLLCVSGVPLVEKAGMKKWGKDQKYLEYVQTTPLLLPKAFLGLVFMFVGVVVFGLLRTQSRE